jgi:sialate O-acetylesterase
MAISMTRNETWTTIERKIKSGGEERFCLDCCPHADIPCKGECEEFKAWNGDGMLYDYALSQVIPFSLSAVVWYQGESDTSEKEAIYYLDELSILINVWRNDFKDEKLPFVIIQISDFITRNDTAWRGIQKAQYDIQFSLPFVKCVISSDVCENDNIHPPTKDKLSARVALALSDLIYI